MLFIVLSGQSTSGIATNIQGTVLSMFELLSVVLILSTVPPFCGSAVVVSYCLTVTPFDCARLSMQRVLYP